LPIENFLAQMKKLDYNHLAKKYEYVPKTERKYTRELRTLDMNDTEVLREFMKLLGIPKRPFKELMEEVKIFTGL